MSPKIKLACALIGGSAIYGIAKARALHPNTLTRETLATKLAGCVIPALREEVMYRRGINTALSTMTNPAAGAVLGSFVFAGGHVKLEEREMLSAYRLADAFVGGLAYSVAHVVCGLPVAVAAHVAHNAGVYIGSLTLPRG